ncbi:unnamed protein product, partial [Discosporangium mesarthrocarpum]
VPITYKIEGLKDELIPPWHMRTLYNECSSIPMGGVGEGQKAGEGKRMLTVADGTHNDTWERGGEEYLWTVAGFIAEVKALGVCAL